MKVVLSTLGSVCNVVGCVAAIPATGGASLAATFLALGALSTVAAGVVWLGGPDIPKEMRALWQPVSEAMEEDDRMHHEFRDQLDEMARVNQEFDCAEFSLNVGLGASRSVGALALITTELGWGTVCGAKTVIEITSKFPCIEAFLCKTYKSVEACVNFFNGAAKVKVVSGSCEAAAEGAGAFGKALTGAMIVMGVVTIALDGKAVYDKSREKGCGPKMREIAKGLERTIRETEDMEFAIVG